MLFRLKRSGYGEVVLSNASSTKSFESHFEKIGKLMTPITTSTESVGTKYEMQNGSQEECPQSPDHAPYAMFDDPIYSETNFQELHRKPRKKTLSFGKKGKLHHTDSSEKLLDDGEDSYPENPRMSDSVPARPQLPPKPTTFQQLQKMLAASLLAISLPFPFHFSLFSFFSFTLLSIAC